jgi:ABC-type sugar transport system ATPase subunit
LASALLEVGGLTKRFGAVTALEAVDLVAVRGEVHALTGANGAGKSTLMNLLAGVYPPSAGEIRLDGEPVQFASPAKAREAGVSSVYQELTVLPQLTVAQNIWLGREPRNRAGLLDRGALVQRTKVLLETYGLPLDPSSLAGTLSVATRQLVEIARALSTSARILTLDEPTAVLSEQERRRLFDTVAALRKQGLLVLFVSHRLDEVFEIADTVTVLRNGRHVIRAATRDLTRAELIRHMVGHSVDEGRRTQRPQRAAPKSISIAVRGPTRVDLELTEGEIVGFGGLVGAGRTRLARRMAGLESPFIAEYHIGEAKVVARSARHAIAGGIVYLTEDRKRDGLFGGLSVLRNASASTLSSLSKFGIVDRRREREVVAPLLEQLKVVAASLDAPVKSLSGGNQQKVLFTRALLARPRLLICDEPTRGVDVGAREDIYNLIERLARDGVAIVLISSDLKELMALCDRVLVIRDARVVAQLPANATELEIVEASVTSH